MRGDPPRVVFDTNIYISAIIFGGNPEKLIRLARSGKIILYISQGILSEVFEVFEGDFGKSQKELADIASFIYAICQLASPRRKLRVIKEDPSDNKILECAQAVDAHFIVTGDKHLLSLKKFKGTAILSTSEFLRESSTFSPS